MAQTVTPPPTSRREPAHIGVFYALSAFLLWALLPVYIKALGAVPPLEIIAHRVVWSVVLMAGLVLLLKRPEEIRQALGGPRLWQALALTTLLISANWLIFVWAIGEGHILQCSLGYYINPLVNVLLGVLFLGERLNRAQGAAVALAVIGVGCLVVQVGAVPWVSLSLALTFGFYALVRKKAAVEPLIGFLVETVLLLPLSLAYLLYLAYLGSGSFGAHGGGFDLLLAASGVVTAVPLVLFLYGARTLKLSTLGLMQYVAPTGQFLLGTLVYGEAFTSAHALAFGFIWLALGLYSWDASRPRP